MLTHEQMVKLLEDVKASGSDMQVPGRWIAANVLVDCLRKRMLELPQFADAKIQETLRSGIGEWLIATLLEKELPRIPGMENDQRLDALCADLRKLGKQSRETWIVKGIYGRMRKESVKKGR